MGSSSNEIAAIRQLLDDRVRAVHAKDLDGLMVSIPPDIRAFDVLDPLQNTGTGTIRKRAERWFPGTKPTSATNSKISRPRSPRTSPSLTTSITSAAP